MSKSSERCPWCLSTERYRDYHDTEWGVPCRDSVALFELINLEGAQAGLSWITILNKRDRYREVFQGFDPEKVARFTDRRIDKLAADPGIVRHRLKVAGVRKNAKAWLDLREAGSSFDAFIWEFVDGVPQQNRFRKMADVPASTDTSLAMSKALKQAGFTFVGPTICYAFMQAAGLVNDHLTSCPRYAEVARL